MRARPVHGATHTIADLCGLLQASRCDHHCEWCLQAFWEDLYGQPDIETPTESKALVAQVRGCSDWFRLVCLLVAIVAENIWCVGGGWVGGWVGGGADDTLTMMCA